MKISAESSVRTVDRTMNRTVDRTVDRTVVWSVDKSVDWSVDKSSVRSEEDESTDGQIIAILSTNPRCTLE